MPPLWFNTAIRRVGKAGEALDFFLLFSPEGLTETPGDYADQFLWVKRPIASHFAEGRGFRRYPFGPAVRQGLRVEF